MANSFIFNDVNMTVYDTTVQRGTIIGTPELFIPSKKIVRADGGIAAETTWGARRIHIEAIVQGTSHADMLENYANVLRFVGQRVTKQLKFESDTSKYYNAKIQNWDYETVGATSRLLTLDFICFDPAAYDSSEDSENDVAGVITAAAGGNTTAYPTFAITTPGATVTITHDVSGNVLTWSGSASTLTITTEPGNKLVVEGATPKMANVSGGWPFLVGAVTNKFTITGAASSSITWRSRYID